MVRPIPPTSRISLIVQNIAMLDQKEEASLSHIPSTLKNVMALKPIQQLNLTELTTLAEDEQIEEIDRNRLLLLIYSMGGKQQHIQRQPYRY